MSPPLLEEALQEEMIQLLAEIGWRPIGRTEMNKFRAGRMDDAIVEPLLTASLQAINEDLTEAEAAIVAGQVRRIVNSDDFLLALRDGLSLPLTPGEQERTVRLVDLKNPSKNDYVVTLEFAMRTGATRQPRLDVVCLVNGMPLGIVETKAPHESWKKAARDFAGYWKDAPQLEAVGAVAVATNGTKFRVGPTGVTGAAGFAQWKDTWPHPIPDGADEFEIGCLGVLEPHTLVDLAANFIAFETRDGKATKKLARYQQYRATNRIVRRVLEGKYDRGIIWHTQGSGKSLTMVFAARKLMRVGLDRPTVLIVIDRRDLDKQINGTFEACSFDGVRKALSRERLSDMLRSDLRGVIVTTVQKFDEENSALQDRDNVIVFVDEAHRSQEGDFGIRMRAALPNARLFAFTGTPVETNDRSTRKAFSPEIDGNYETYLDAYSIKQAIEDRATVQIIYEPGPVDWQVAGDDVDKAFEHDFAHLTEDEREHLKREAARRSVVAKTPDRIAAIAADVARHLRQRTTPAGFKGQLVAVDREACVSYAEELSKHLGPDEFVVIYSGNKHDDERMRGWYAAPQWHRVSHDTDAADEPLGHELGEQRAMEKLVELFKKPDGALKLLIVNNMLLTGFDAPVEQVMFLDRGLRAHGLLQAIARTNRPFPEKKKEYGVVVDYWGILSKLQEAFADFSPEDVELAALSVDELCDRFPVALAEAHAVVAAIPAGKSERQQMAWLVEYLADPKRAETFEERYQTVQSLYEALAPDARLAEYLDSFKRLTQLHAVWRHGARQDDDFDVAEYRAHTQELVQEAISIERLRRDLPVFRINEEYLSKLEQEELTPEEKAAEIETALVHEIKIRGDHDPLARSLSERLKRLRETQERSDQLTLDLLKGLEGLAGEFSAEQQAREDLGLSEQAYAIVALARRENPGLTDDQLSEFARATEQRWADVSGYTDRDKDMRQALTRMLARDPATRSLLKTPFIDDAINALAEEASSPTPAGGSVDWPAET